MVLVVRIQVLPHARTPYDKELALGKMKTGWKITLLSKHIRVVQKENENVFGPEEKFGRPEFGAQNRPNNRRFFKEISLFLSVENHFFYSHLINGINCDKLLRKTYSINLCFEVWKV